MPNLTPQNCSQGSRQARTFRGPQGPWLGGWAALLGLLGLLVPVAGLSGCQKGASAAASHICVAGSTSVQPFAEKLAEIYMQKHPEAVINVQGGGSSAGIYAAMHGAAELGASSRELAPAEKELKEIPIAYDGIAVILHPSNPLTNLTIPQIRQIFEGAITDWQALGLPPHSIDVISREEGSGTREAFEHLVMGQVEVSPSALVQDSNGAVREIVANDPHSIGYISVGLVDKRVKDVAVDGIAPTAENIRSRTYKLVRRFLLVSKAEPAGLCRSFIEFVLSPQGQQVLEAEGLVGVK